MLKGRFVFSFPGQNESKPRVFSLRMDYDEWTPLGRGDPLKNNPTFDYVPPVLDRVQYWLDSHTTEPSTKRDILVLGVTAKKTSPKIPEQFLKFVDGPKFTRSSHQESVSSYRNDFTGSTGAEPPKLVRTSNFRNGPLDYRNQNRIQSIPSSYYPSPFYNQKTKPYTMMLPPPLTQKDKIVSFVEPTQQFNTQTEEGPVLQDAQFYAPLPPSKAYNQPGKSPQLKFPPSKSPISTQVETIKSVYGPSSPQSTRPKHETATTPSVSLEKSNLIYQSTQTLSGGWPPSPGGGPLSTSTTSNGVRQATDYSGRDQYESIDHQAAGSSNHEVVVEQNANIIVDGDSNENEEVVVGQKGVDTASPVTISMTTITTTDSVNDENENAEDEKMHIVVANSPHDLTDTEATHEAKKGPVAVVMPTNYSEKKATSSSSVTPAMETIATSNLPENSTTMETETSRVEFQPIRNSAIRGSSFVSENSQSPLSPNKLMSSVQQHGMHFHSTMAPPFSSRRPVDSLLGFGPPQAPLSSMMHPQTRPNHGTMHVVGGMRPTVGFRAPASMPMFPPMTHMHAPPPVRSTIDHVDYQSGAHRSPQLHNFPAMSPDSPPLPTLTAHSIGQSEEHYFDRHRSRIPDTSTASIFTTPTAPSFLPTVSSSAENSSVPLFDGHTRHPEMIDRAPVRTSTEGKREEEEEKEEEENRKNVSTTPRITTMPSLTTDPIFSHYKQPAKPIRGPMYLIIQGHSKVKTYKPTVSKHGIPVEGNEIFESATERQLSKFEQFVQENTRNNNRANQAVIEKKKAEEKARSEKLARARQNDLMSLVESGLASFTVPPSSSTTEDEHRVNSVTTIEINGN